MNSVNGTNDHPINDGSSFNDNDYWKKIDTQPFKAELLTPPDAMLGGDIDINQIDFMSYINNDCGSPSKTNLPPNFTPSASNFSYIGEIPVMGTIAPKNLLSSDPIIGDGSNSFAIEFIPNKSLNSFNPNLFIENRPGVNFKTQIPPLNGSISSIQPNNKSLLELPKITQASSSNSLDSGTDSPKRSFSIQQNELNKRDAHMASEQRRRAQMKDAYDTLAQLLPPEEYRKQTKANLLNASINYIRKLIKSYKLLEQHYIKMQEELKILQLQLQRQQQQIKEKREREKEREKTS